MGFYQQKIRCHRHIEEKYLKIGLYHSFFVSSIGIMPTLWWTSTTSIGISTKKIGETGCNTGNRSAGNSPELVGQGGRGDVNDTQKMMFFCWWCILYLNFDPQFRTICDVVLACWKIMKIEDQEVALPAKKCILAKHLGVCLWDLQNHQEWYSETNMGMQPVKGIKYQTRVNIGWLGPEWSGMQQYFLSESRTLAIEPSSSVHFTITNVVFPSSKTLQNRWVSPGTLT